MLLRFILINCIEPKATSYHFRQILFKTRQFFLYILLCNLGYVTFKKITILTLLLYLLSKPVTYNTI